jgi:hypothetical protein
VFILQKKIIRTITNTKPRYSCRKAFKKLEIMTYSQYIYSLVLYTVNDKHLFYASNEIRKYKTMNNNTLHLPLAGLSKFNKGAFISGIKVFNHLPQYSILTLNLSTTTIVAPPCNVIKWQIKFNLVA